MEHNEDTQGRLARFDSGDHQLTIVTQLSQMIVRMQHIDEVFLWLTRSIMHYLKTEVAQIWTTSLAPGYRAYPTLRATSFYDPSLHEHMFMNAPAVQVVNQVLHGQQNMLLHAVETLLPTYQSSLLKRYGLNYYSCGLTISNLAIPPAHGSTTAQQEAGPSAIAAVFYLGQPRSQTFLATIISLLEQTLSIARSYDWLFAPKISQTSPSLERQAQQQQQPLSTQDALLGLIPDRTRSNDSMRSSSPFARAVPLPDKNAVALLSAVDGSKTLAEIAMSKRMSTKDMFAALSVLLQQDRLQLYTRERQLISKAEILKMLPR